MLHLPDDQLHAMSVPINGKHVLKVGYPSRSANSLYGRHLPYKCTGETLVPVNEAEFVCTRYQFSRQWILARLSYVSL